MKPYYELTRLGISTSEFKLSVALRDICSIWLYYKRR